MKVKIEAKEQNVLMHQPSGIFALEPCEEHREPSVAKSELLFESYRNKCGFWESFDFIRKGEGGGMEAVHGVAGERSEKK